jgi:UPF0755 protein
MQVSPHSWSRTFRGLITVAFAFVLLVTLEIFSRFLLEGSAAEGPRQMVEIAVPENANIAQIGQILYEHKLIEHPVLFRYAVRIMGADTKIQAGNMMLASGQSLFDLIRNLSHTKALGIPVTVPEGETAADIAGLLQQKIGVDSAQFMDLVSDTQYVRELGLEGPSFEGYLFPDTYFIAKGTDPKRIISRMVADYHNHVPKDMEERSTEMGITPHDVLTLASIIQWEAYVPSEAPLISSVYHNRLKRGMLLQADPTVGYALGKGPSRLHYSDLKVDSPYNTYVFPGLPPGPINNPGVLAITAALHPATTNYLYFVAKGDGTHAFSVSYSEHLTAKQQLDRIRRDSASPDTSHAG